MAETGVSVTRPTLFCNLPRASCNLYKLAPRLQLAHCLAAARRRLGRKKTAGMAIALLLSMFWSHEDSLFETQGRNIPGGIRMKKAICFCIAATSLVLFSQASICKAREGRSRGRRVVAARSTARLDARSQAQITPSSRIIPAMVSQEHVRGKLLDENIMQMKVKTEPFSVYMPWLAPAKLRSRKSPSLLARTATRCASKATS